jgi:tRNA (adenine37-N6)-methyltransferase
MKTISLSPIGFVHSSRKKIEDDNWDTEKAYVELDSKTFTADSLSGLGDFSHVEIIFYMDQIELSKIETTSRHPRGNKNWPKVGIFAQRAKYRPNQIGVTICKILKIEDTKLYTEGLDAVDGTPVLDIKPWVREFEPRGQVFQPTWITELMKDYWASK